MSSQNKIPVVLQTESRKNYENDFKSFLPLHGHVFKTLREQSMQAFLETGFPKAKEEEYKYLNLSSLSGFRFNRARATFKSTITRSEIQSFKVAGSDALVLVFVNGIFQPSLSDLENEVDGMYTGTEMDSVLAGSFGQSVEINGHAFNALNTAFFMDCACVYIHENKQTSRPVHIMHLTDSRIDQVAVFPRNLIVAGKNSKAQILVTYHSFEGEFSSLCNSVTEVFVEENAFVELDIKQSEVEMAIHFNQVYATQKKNSLFDISTVTIGGGLVRNNLTIRLTETNCTAHLYGLTLGDRKQVVDHHTVVDHMSPNCMSNQLYKCLLDGESQGVFNGKIFVRKNAQKTNAYQSSKNVLLSDKASMNAKPQLEIFADDVKCSHGATTGQLDDDALFYFRARGIGEQDARALLNFAFASDVIEKINNQSLRKDLLKLLAEKLNSQIEFDLP